MKTRLTTSIILILAFAVQTALGNEGPKGSLDEIRLSESNEELNQSKTFTSEVMITKAENKAIETLKKLIKKKAGTSEEVDMLYRLAELYMRRSKSGRFFDLDSKLGSKLNEFGIKNQSARESLNQALEVYNQILKRFPKYPDLDYVLFNSALAYSQINQMDPAKRNYLQLLSQFPKSPLVPDALLEVGEIFYQQKNFTTALEKLNEIEKFPESRAYHYGLYKAAWCYYNLHNSESAIKQLVRVVKENPPEDTENDKKKHNLRKESLRDLVLFVGETMPPKELYSFFDKLTTKVELGEIMVALAGLYESHSRYKEISIFADDFIKNNSEHEVAPQLFSKLVETLETLKLRDQVISKLGEMAKFCTNDNKTENCRKQFKNVSLEISKKWWEIWLKNKNHSEFSSLTERAFENLLTLDSPESPDSTSRYAFAELLFQQGKFDRAMEQYKQVSEHKKIEPALKHDALYGALFSVEKSLQKAETPELIEMQRVLGHRYISEFANGEHFKPISFKLGFIYYKQKKYDESYKFLFPLSTDKKVTEELNEKSQDLILDILNIRKDFKSIQTTAKLYSETAKKSERIAGFKKIQLEANYSQMQLENSQLAANLQIEKLLDFASHNKDTQLGQQSNWQAISIAYANKQDVRGAEMSLKYVDAYPTDKNNIDALKEAIKAFTDSARLELAVQTLEKLSKLDPTSKSQNKMLICDLQKIDAKLLAARKCYQQLLGETKASDRSLLLQKIMSTFEEKSGSEYSQLQQQILQLNIEPYATKILIEQANQLLASGKDSAAFSLSLKINARDVSEDVRAEARLIQAKILEKEFINQSVKAREDKLAMVLSMKTEKLDKSFTAYSSAIKMSKQDNVQREGLMGIDRLYSHFIDAITNMPLPETLAEADQKALREELSKLTKPFIEKRQSNQEQLHKVVKMSITASQDIDWSEYPVNKSVEPLVRFPKPEQLSWFLPVSWTIDKKSPVERMLRSTQPCDEKSLNPASLNSCLLSKKLDTAERMALKLTETPEYRSIGLYYLSLVSEGRNQLEKSIWLADKSFDNNPQNLSAIYQKSKVLFSVKEVNTALSLFEKLIDIKSQTSEVQLVAGIKAFSDREFKSALKEFSGLTVEQNYNYGVDIMHIETKTQTGSLEEAQKLAESYLSVAGKKPRVELSLSVARLYESFMFNRELALRYYNQALTNCTQETQKAWLQRKIEFLKNNKNQLSSNVGGE